MTFFQRECRNTFTAIVLILCMVSSCAPCDKYVTVSGYAQGGVYSVKFNLNGRDGMIRESLSTIKDSIDRIINAVDISLSGYNRSSLVSRFNEGEKIRPDSLFVDIYDKAFSIYEATGGVVDVASAPLFDIWGFGFKNGQLPDGQMVENALRKCGMERLQRNISICPDGTLNPADLLLTDGPLPALNYNAIAQGYTCDLVASYLYELGVTDMLVDIGEIYCDGYNPSGNAWTLGIDRPVDGNNTPGAELQAVFKVPEGPHGVVTSGNYRKFYVRDGKKYAHTIDPRTGYPVSHSLLSATVIAPDALTADAYATYCMVIGLEESMKFIEASSELEACLIYDDGGEFRIWSSSGFDIR